MKNPTRHALDDGLYILVPGLLGDTGISLSALEGTPQALTSLLSKANAQPFNETDLLGGVSGLMPGLPSDCLRATAAFRYIDDTGRRPPGYCLAADPAHLEVGREQIIMGQHQGMEITPEEVLTLRELLEADISRHGVRLEVTQPGHWYLHLDRAPDANFATGQDIGGQGIRDHMPSGPDAGPWRTLISDAQILLHDCPSNQARAVRGKPAINSLWLWGGGVLPSEIDARRDWAAAASDDPVIRGLTRLIGCPEVMPLPSNSSDYAAWIEKRINNGPILITIDSMATCPAQVGPDAWWRALLALDEHWLQPALKALSAKRLKRLTLIPLNGKIYQITPRLYRRWWKRQRPLEHFLAAPE